MHARGAGTMDGMPYRQHTFDNAAEMLAAVRAELERQGARGAVPVLLASSAAAAMRLRRALAEAPGAPAARVEAVDSWVGDRWELYGDGRLIVGPGERELLVRRACGESDRAALDGCALDPTPGVVDVLARLAREALPNVLDAGGKRACAAGLSPAERAVVAALGRYASLLRDASLCETSQACAELPSVLVEAPPIVLAGMDDPVPAHERLFAELAARCDVVRFDDGCRRADPAEPRAAELRSLLDRLFSSQGDAVEPTGAVRFLLPAGRYAAPRLVSRAVADLVARERERAREEGRPALPVAVAARDPRALFGDVADDLLQRGATAAVSARRRFADTAFGRSFIALLAFSFDGSFRISQASDFALSAFSGIAWRTACELDASWRSDRTVDRERVLRDLAAASESSAPALEALARGDADAALAVFEAQLRRRVDFDPAFRSEQLAAVSAARAFAGACARVGAALLEERALLSRVSVATAATTCTGADAEPLGARPDARFMTLAEAAELAPCSCAALVLCDLTADAHPVRAMEDGGALLFEKLGIGHRPDALADARRRFFRALSCVRHEVVCERVLNTAEADEVYPAVMLEELLDCYRGPGSEGADDRATGLPAPLAPFSATAGEEALHGNLALCAGEAGGEGRRMQVWELPEAGRVSPGLRGRIVLGGQGPLRPDGAGPGVALSPSAIESYLECPYKWFALRRLRLSEPDAGFGPLEMGSFSHGVLKSFYERFREAGHAKVGAENLPEARDLMRETFERHLAFQHELKRSRNPLVPRTKLEEAEARALEKRLVAYLDREAALLPGFVPARFEFGFGSDGPFPYAGCSLRGSIDRIDVNDRGQAVVIDYKGSLGADYALDSSSEAAQAGGAALPHKVQALVYAQVARKLLGLDVVGALYVSYGRDGRLLGAFDRRVLGEESLPGIDAQRCGVPGPAGEALGAATFAELVDAVEERIGSAVRSLASGLIAPDPRGSDPCGYCPVLSCERRREP